MKIRLADTADIDFLEKHDRHIKKEELLLAVSLRRILIAECKEERVGWLRWNLFWDNTPFMNMLFVLDKYQKQGYGVALVSFWEEQRKEEGYGMVLTSTLADEAAQHFYRKLHYVDSGALLLPGEPLEIIFRKEIG